MSRPQGSTVLNFLRNLLMAFHNECVNLHTHSLKGLFFPHGLSICVRVGHSPSDGGLSNFPMTSDVKHFKNSYWPFVFLLLKTVHFINPF